MSYEVEMPESTDAGGGNFATEEGWFHFACMELEESPTSKAGQMLDGFRAGAEILSGEVAGQEGKSLEFMFFNPKLTDKNNGEMAKKKQARFLLATGVLDSAAVKPGEKVTVDLQVAVGRQFVAKVVHDNREGGSGKFLQLNFADIYHVDDPAVAKVPKCQKSLGLLPATLRKKPESFAKPKAEGNGNGSTGGTAPAAKREPVPASSVSLDDL